MLRTAICVLISSLGATAQLVIPLSPLDTFLRTQQDPAARDSLALPIQAWGVQPGDWLRLRALGDWDAGGTGDIMRELVGVFAGGGTLLAPTLQQRLTAPVSAGTAHVRTSGTTIGNLPMDIPQDFWISRQGASDEVTIRVPAGAAHLYVGVPDAFYSDNTDPDGNFGIEITLVPPPAYPGSNGEDLLLGTSVGGPLTLAPIKTANGGSVVTAAVMSPLDLMAGTIVLIIVDHLPPGPAPIGPLPCTWFSPTALIPFVALMPSGTPSASLQINIPAGLGGSSLWLQGGALWNPARNGLAVISEAHEIRLQ
jgi:hypothetical protein